MLKPLSEEEYQQRLHCGAVALTNYAASATRGVPEENAYTLLGLCAMRVIRHEFGDFRSWTPGQIPGKRELPQIFTELIEAARAYAENVERGVT